MSGIAAYGDLAEIIFNSNTITLKHALESVRFELGDESTEPIWGSTTKQAVEEVERTNLLVNRVFNLSVGAQPEFPLKGKPTSWSAAIDSICFKDGYGRLMTIAAGNVFPITKSGYPHRNLASEIDDPAHAINPISVGGYTELTDPVPPLPGYELIAYSGELSPHSRTGPAKYAVKPEIVCEAGNVVFDDPMWEDCHDGISLLTTNKNYYAKPLINTACTSMAAPAAARMLALIWADNSNYRPATIRGLLIHSASCTEAMTRQFRNKYELLRACGYGVPNLELACHSAKSAVTLVAEDEIACGYEDKDGNKKTITRDMCSYKIPWPVEELLELGSLKVELRVTLSYFIEPNPRQTAYTYEGASLAWDMQGPAETDEEFFKRINKARREEDESGFKSELGWVIGAQIRSRGSVQSDRLYCTAAELAGCGHVVVFPRHGWWKDNAKKRPNPYIPYSLIISVVTVDQDVNLYVPIEALVSVVVDG